MKPNPRAQGMAFKEPFIARYSELTDWEDFKRYSTSYLRKSIRVNTLKIPVKDVVKRLKNDWTLEKIPWCKEGFFIEGVRRDIGNLPEHMLGYIYVQDAASMIPPLVLDPKSDDTVLDMCSAPGSKTTQIAQYMKNGGLLIANDSDGVRLKALGINLQRSGVTNTIITQMQGRYFAKKDLEFDRILLDAPCSGTGTIRKSLKTIDMWNPNMVRRLAGTQRQLLDSAWRVLRPGGTLVYSTCTLEPEEDEEVIDFALNRFEDAKVEKIKLKINRSPSVLSFEGKEYDGRIKDALRIWPQDNDTEGFFICKLKKI